MYPDTISNHCAIRGCCYEGKFICDGCSISCCLDCGHNSVVIICNIPFRLQLCKNCNILHYPHIQMDFK